MDVTWHQAGDRRVRSLSTGAPRRGVPALVVVPGLGALGYQRPLLAACRAWTDVHLLDVPGFGHPETARCPSSLDDVAGLVAAWLRAAPRGPVLLMGHSTGAQAALRAALTVPDQVAGLVLVGPTFPPRLRRWAPLITQTVRTALREPPKELPTVLPEWVRGRSRILTLLRSAMADQPEHAVPHLTCPLLVLRGRHDAVSPEDWAELLAARGRKVTLPGAHNIPFTHPELMSAAIQGLLT